MAKIALLDAAKMMQETYEKSNIDQIHTEINVAGVQAVYLKSGVLVIPGTNEFTDWFDFNLDVFSIQVLHLH